MKARMPGSVGFGALMSAPLPYRIALLGEGAEAFHLVLAVVKSVDGGELPLGDPVHGVLEGHRLDRKSVVWGKSVYVRVDLGGSGIIKKKNQIIRIAQ